MALTVREWRRVKELSQESVAKSLGVHVNTYQNWEQDPGKISIEKAFELAKIFGVSLNEISFKSAEKEPA